MLRKKQKRHLIVTIELRQITPSMLIAERKVWYTNVRQQSVTRKINIFDWLRESLKSKSTMNVSNLFETNFMPTVLLTRVMYWKWKIKKDETPALTWEIWQSTKAYSNIIKRCSLCLYDKLTIIAFPYSNELLNRCSELVAKCRHENKFLLKKL